MAPGTWISLICLKYFHNVIALKRIQIIIKMKKVTHDISKTMKSNWVKSLAVNTVILVLVLLTTNLIYETNDDYAIATRIADGYPYVNFINYYLCRILIPLQELASEVNIYVLFQIIVSFFAFVVILKILLDSCKSRLVSVVAAMVILIFSVDHYCVFQFTKTSALLLITGMLVLIDAMIVKRGWQYYLMSMLFLYLGVAFRVDGLIAIIGFGGIFLIFWVVWNRKILISEGYLTGKRIIMYVTLLLVIGGCYGFQVASDRVIVSTDELKAYKEYSELRSDVVDYPVYEYYSENEEAYDSIGITENDLYLVDHWYFDYNGAASEKNLKKILEVNSQIEKTDKSVADIIRTFVKYVNTSVKKLSFTGVHIILLLVLAIWAAAMVRPKDWIYIIAVGVFSICLYLALFYMGRPAYRAMYVADIGAAIWLLYFVNYKMDKLVDKKLLISKSIICLMAAAVMLLMMVPVWSGCNEKYECIKERQMPKTLSCYVSERKNTMFIFPVNARKNSEDYMRPLAVPKNKGGVNVMGTGSWGTMSPYVLSRLECFGMENPIRDLINNPTAFYVDRNDVRRLTEYYNRWYGKEMGKISMVCVEKIDGYGIWKVISQAQ